MSDPRRLLEADPDDMTANLLRSALDDDPSPRALARTTAALGAAGMIHLASGAAAAEAALAGASTGAKLGGALAIKWLGIGATAGLLVGAGAGVAQRSLAPVPSPSAAVSALAPAPVSGAPVVRVAPPPANAPPVTDDPKSPPTDPVTSPASGAAPPAVSRAPTIADEIATLDRARVALQRDDPGAALAAIDELERTGTTALGAEATVLRAEAFVARGQKARAAALARRFIADNPRSPHVARMREIAGDAP